ncbi:PspC domain-containing protein [Bowmanella dokdonensis]|uniref:PspC domain-containing protein n=1 Tax=Bowmanella dokdonensis TaxID=751969 RepID=A0A939DRE3_9ALTE|nr:PspC domain-containing protein [Bowmanella dokdonensis]MBN7827422.1 PspC domain-containing protein [Bowmanella dokdonensis]
MNTYYPSKRVSKDRSRGKIAGVCAGLAQHWNMQPWIVRILALVLFFHLPLATLVAYLVAALVLPSR